MRPTSPSQLIKVAGVPSLLVSNCTNIYYLTGMRVSTGFVLVKKRSLLLFVDPRYYEAAQHNAYPSVKVCPLSSLDSAIAKISVLGFESQNVTIDAYTRMKKRWKNTSLKKVVGAVEHFRRSKDTTEIRYFKKAQSITHTMMKRVPQILQNGVTEKGVALELYKAAIELGADQFSFDPIVAFGSNTSRPHHHPTTRKLKKGNIVQIDCGVEYKGYCSDQSRVFFTGPITALQKKVYEALTEAKKVATATIASGIRCSIPDKAAREILKKYNLEQYFTHALGHGVGLEIHEGISLSQRAKCEILQKGEIVTIEPGVYIPDKFGMRIEDEIIVK